MSTPARVKEAAAPEGAEDHFDSWRRFGFALLPLAAWGLMPWWLVLSLCAVTALGVWKSSFGQLHVVFLLTLVSLGALVGFPAALQGTSADMVAWSIQFFAWCATAVSINLGISRLEDGSYWGLLLAALPTLFAPTPAVLPALAGGLLARPAHDDRLGRIGEPNRRVWVAVLLALGAALVFSLSLPRGYLRPPLPSAVAEQQVRRPGQPTLPQSQARPESAAAPKMKLPIGFDIDDKRMLKPEAGLAIGGLLLLVLGIGMLFVRSGALDLKKNSLAEKLAAFGLLLIGAIILMAAFLSQGSGGGGAGEPGLGGLASIGGILQKFVKNISVQRHVDITTFTNGLLWLGMVGGVLLAIAVYFALRRAPAPLEDPPPSPLEEEDLSAPQAPLHRVRLAYRNAEEALLAVGRVRSASETPRGFAGRLSTQYPQLRPAFAVLVQAYAPVRYGGQVSEETADAAEQASRELQEMAAGLPALADPGEAAQDLPPLQPDTAGLQRPDRNKESL